jgi:hypothetical protein
MIGGAKSESSTHGIMKALPKMSGELRPSIRNNRLRYPMKTYNLGKIKLSIFFYGIRRFYRKEVR